MNERLKSIRLPEIISTLLGIAIVLFFLNKIIFLLFLHYSNSFQTNAKWHYSAFIKQPVDWLILGDSCCNQGVNPQVITHILTGSAINLGAPGRFGVPGVAWMLNDHIEKVGAPKNVIISLYMANYVIPIEDKSLPLIPFGGFFLERLKPPHKISWNLNFLLRRNFFLYAEKDMLNDYFRFPLTIPRLLLFYQPNGFAQAFRIYRENTQEFFKEEVEKLEAGHAVLSDDAKKGLQQISEWAQQYQFKVYISLPPVEEMYYNDPTYQKHLKVFLTSLTANLKNYPNLHLVDTVVAYPGQAFQTPHHLQYGGAERYSEDLANAIKKSTSQ